MLRLLEQDPSKRLGCGSKGTKEIFDHPYWKGVEWEMLPLKKFESPCKGVKPPDKPKRRKEKEKAAVETAGEMANHTQSDDKLLVSDWDFVSPSAIVDEYMENMYRLVSAL